MNELKENAACGVAMNPLQAVRVFVHLHDVLSVVHVRQVYRNVEKEPIEAIFTFPVPLDGIFLGVEVEIGGRCLRGKAVERNDADKRYEQSVADGDVAMLMQELEPGLYALNLGNLKSGENAEIVYRYAELHRWRGDQLRFLLPVVTAPRYGATPHEFFQTPDVDFFARNEYALEVRITGNLATAEISCPSHDVRIERDADSAYVRPKAARLTMDRDFILNFHLQKEKDFGLYGRCDSGVVSLASFTPRASGGESVGGRNIKIVCDCSGSMAGDSIHEARRALALLLDALRPQDKFTVLRFGSHATLLYPDMKPADAVHVDEARYWVQGMQADMGGTEMGGALRKALAVPAGEECDLVLITDGEIWAHDDVITLAKKSGHRLFTIGVGSAACEALVQRLARETGGVCELVAPHEDMREAVRRHMRRIRGMRVHKMQMAWPMRTLWEWPAGKVPTYDGDTVFAFAGSNDVPSDAGLLTRVLEDGSDIRQECCFRKLPSSGEVALDGETLARIAAAHRIRNMEPKEALALALQHDLLCEYTSFLVVCERSEQEEATGMPMLRKVPHMLAAGWGGMGSVVEGERQFLTEMGQRSSLSPEYFSMHAEYFSMHAEYFSMHGLGGFTTYYLPDKGGRQQITLADLVPVVEGHGSGNWSNAEGEEYVRTADPGDVPLSRKALTAFFAALNNLCADKGNGALLGLVSIESLVELGLPREVALELMEWCEDEDQWLEEEVVVAFLRWLGRSSFRRELSSRTRRAVTRLTGRCDELGIEALEDEDSNFHEALELVMAGKRP